MRKLIVASALVLSLASVAQAGPFDSAYRVQHVGPELWTWSVMVTLQDGTAEDATVALAFLFGDGLWVYGWFGPHVLEGGTVRIYGQIYTSDGQPFGYVNLAITPSGYLAGDFFEDGQLFRLEGQRLL
jgi:hypothetical protein